MTRKTFEEKYYGVLTSMFVAGGRVDDTGVCADKLICSIRGHFGETYTDGAGTHVFEQYPGIPEDFNWEEAYEDYKTFVKVAE
jgi:hypothetical protein